MLDTHPTTAEDQARVESTSSLFQRPYSGYEWRCVECSKVYGEYVNGCPACWENNDTRSGVRLLPVRLNQYGLTASEWTSVVESASALHTALYELDEDENRFDGESDLIVQCLVARERRYLAALAKAVAHE